MQSYQNHVVSYTGQLIIDVVTALSCASCAHFYLIQNIHCFVISPNFCLIHSIHCFVISPNFCLIHSIYCFVLSPNFCLIHSIHYVLSPTREIQRYNKQNVNMKPAVVPFVFMCFNQ